MHGVQTSRTRRRTARRHRQRPEGVRLNTGGYRTQTRATTKVASSDAVPVRPLTARPVVPATPNAVSAIIAVAGTILGSALTYIFQSRTSARTEASVLQRELRIERRSVYSTYSTTLTEFRRGQLDWYNRRKEDASSAATLAARFESCRLKGVALAALSEVQLVAGDPAVVAAANNAFELTRPVHYARDGANLDSRTEEAKSAVDRFIALAVAEIQSSRIPDHIANEKRGSLSGREIRGR